MYLTAMYIVYVAATYTCRCLYIYKNGGRNGGRKNQRERVESDMVRE